jgi:hypothetical protein
MTRIRIADFLRELATALRTGTTFAPPGSARFGAACYRTARALDCVARVIR